MAENNDHLILLTGATGYVGGRLLRLLEQEGRPVRCLARRPEFLRPKVSPTTEVAGGDVMEPDSLEAALQGVHTAYYMIHSMGSRKDFQELDRRAAHNFGAAARAVRVRRIIYLGGLGDDDDGLSPHLLSRQEVGEILRQYDTPVLELRASIVLGSGSLSFEMIRALVERLPVMITPRWVAVKAQPIAVSDLLAYLREALDIPLDGHRIFEIGGTDQVSYGELMREYARQRGLKRLMIPVPVLTPRLSSLWLGLVTPLYARIGRKLVDSLRHETVVRNPAAAEVFSIRPRGVAQAIADALHNEDAEFAATRWSDAISSAGPTRNWGGTRFGNRLIDFRRRETQLPPRQAFAPIRLIGGRTGWYYANWLWRVRGFIDLLMGGVGLRRGRPHPEVLSAGDTIDWWRVEEYIPDRRLRLLAEMKLPGRAWLEFEVEPAGDGAIVKQTAIFDPVGLWGIVYWYGIYPIHGLIFRNMLRGIVRAAEAAPEEAS
ncbi:MAG: SDR family oxidoreductase [Acidobacteria bacterium]|nr:SDR family oxidoreductase [Acidobacteriota bacterium]